MPPDNKHFRHTACHEKIPGVRGPQRVLGEPWIDQNDRMSGVQSGRYREWSGEKSMNWRRRQESDHEKLYLPHQTVWTLSQEQEGSNYKV